MGSPAEPRRDAISRLTARLRWIQARAPLRVRLVGALLLLVAVALTGSGIAAVATLRSYLVDRVDSQLMQVRPLVESTLSDTVRGPTGLPSGPRAPGGGPGGGGPGRLPNSYVVEVTGATGMVVYGPTGVLVTTSQPLPSLPHLSAANVAARGPHGFTVGAADGGAPWRVLAVPVTLIDGSAGTMLIAQSLSDVQNTTGHLIVLLVVIGAAAVVVLGALGYVIVRRSLRPLRDVERSAAQIAAGDLSHRVPATADPRTEVGGLSSALNTMLGQIENAFAHQAASEEAARGSERRMRRFVADASHELRTPLTTIRGFAELYRQGAVSDPVELVRLMRRIEDEARRMGLLVEDLLTLARLDQQRPMTQEPVDLLAVARDAVGDARVVDPTRRIELRIGSLDPPPVVIGDEARLRQVLNNLVTNALQHTPPGTPVTVRIATSSRAEHPGPGVRLSVEDEGPGMSAADAERVFERFYRADVARDRSDGGTGLGLSIVAALVAAHRGSVWVEAEPGVGARFHVALPLAD